MRAKIRGTQLHDFAYNAIILGIELPDTQQTLNMYVNDVLGFGMKPEVVLKPFKDNEIAFGTADAIGYNLRERTLRIFDLKTGFTKTSFLQLRIYTAFFCLEYDVNPNDIDIDLRIYQNDDIKYENPDREEIFYIMEKIKSSVKILKILEDENGGR